MMKLPANKKQYLFVKYAVESIVMLHITSTPTYPSKVSHFFISSTASSGPCKTPVTVPDLRFLTFPVNKSTSLLDSC